MTSRRPGNPPQISIGLPVFNGERFIAEAIECVLSQTFGDFELVISDNASTDTTREICLAFCRQDPRVRYERNSLNVGAAPNFNRCFVLAQPSQYFKWMAYDDLMSDDFLERCIDALEQDPKASIAFPEMVHADSGGNVTERQFRKDLSLLDEEPGRRVQRLVQYGLEAPDIFGASMRSCDGPRSNKRSFTAITWLPIKCSSSNSRSPASSCRCPRASLFVAHIQAHGRCGPTVRRKAMPSGSVRGHVSCFLTGRSCGSTSVLFFERRSQWPTRRAADSQSHIVRVVSGEHSEEM